MAKTITIKPETHARLTSIGKKGESYDDIINRIIESYIAFTQGG